MNEWSTKRLGDLAEIRMCKRVFASQTTTVGEVPFYKIGTFGKEPDAFISRELYEEYRSKYSFPSKGDILLSAAGTLGRTVVYDGKPAYYQDSNIVWLDVDKKQLSNNFLFYYYKIIKWTSPEGSTISRLYNDIIRATEVFLPPLDQQHAIAEVLSDVDGYIAALEKLIAKKQNIIKGVMQELLTGKRRLPGFEKEWAEKSLGEFGIRKGRVITKSTAKPGRIPVVAGGKVAAYYHNEHNRDENTIALSASGAYAGFVSFWKCKIFASDCSTIEASQNYNVKWLYYNLLNRQNEIFRLQTGGAQPHVQPPDLEPLVVMTPELIEQNSIANLITELDAEIDRLSLKLDKLRDIKEGMMQELLTGRIRLVTDSENLPATNSKPFLITERERNYAKN